MQRDSQHVTRPPIVVVMGHVDHGKTTLLDFIRKTNVAAKESGGITQHIGAYETTFQGRSITFLDTPGHEAFSKMRSRGAKVADIAILVVAADEGVKPQTKEAISHILESKIPMIVAINKIDRPGADPQRVRQELASANVLVEGWGGSVPVAEISAKTGQGVDTLLELILLVADMEELQTDPAAPAEGVVIESQLDRKRGLMATLLVQNGTLKRGDAVLAGSAFAKVKLLENFEGKPAEYISASSPCRLLGWETLPQVGEYFRAGTEEALRPLAEEFTALRTETPRVSGDVLLIVKADMAGSQEALTEAIMRLPAEGVEVAVLSSGVGDVSESDVKLAYAAGALIVAFRVRILPAAELFLKQYPVRIIASDIIYELMELVEKEISRAREEKAVASIRARLEVLAVFGTKGSRQIVGGKVTEGTLKNRMIVSVLRRGEKIGRAKIVNLQKERRDVDAVETGNECGVLLESNLVVMKGDILEEEKDETA